MPIPVIILGVVLVALAGGVSQPQNTNINTSTSTGIFSVSQDRPVYEVNTTPTYTPARPAQRVNYESSQRTTAQNAISAIGFPAVETYSARNIEDRSVIARGAVSLNGNTADNVFFVLSDRQQSLATVPNRYLSYETLSNNTQDIEVINVFRNTQGNRDVERRIGNLSADTRYYYRLCITYEGINAIEQILCGGTVSFDTNERLRNNDYFVFPYVYTNRATNITDGSAELSGRVTLNSAEEAVSFLVYGEDRALVNAVPSEYDEYRDIEEADEDLQKVRLNADVRKNEEYVRVIDDLEEETEHYFRFCIEFDGEEQGIRCSSVFRFTTDDSSRTDTPFVRSEAAIPFGTNAQMNGSVRMRDFNDGHVFLVYGTDERRVESVAGKNSFSRIFQTGESLQRVSLDTDHDGNDSFSRIITDLLSREIYYFRFCVEFEDEDEFDREIDFVNCSDIRSFVTS